jgi:hypothetical protein
LELTSVVPTEYKPYFAGWSRRTSFAPRSVTIHHPDADIKKISFANHSLALNSELPIGWPDDPASHWEVLWDAGSTEGGSSGAPLFDDTHRIIGDLSGGSASCANAEGTDLFTIFGQAWNKYPDQNTSLYQWLDPLGIDPETFEGFDASAVEADLALDEIVHPADQIHPNQQMPVTVVVTNRGLVTLEGFKLVATHNTDEFVVNDTRTLAPGVSAVLTLEQIELAVNGTLAIEVQTLPADADDNPVNNLMEINYRQTSGRNLSIRFSPEPGSNSVGWQLHDANSEPVRSHNAHVFTVADYPVVLQNACYVLQLNMGYYGANFSLYDNDTQTALLTDNSHQTTELRFCLTPENKPFRTIHNPGANLLEVHFGPNQSGTIELFDLNGHLLYRNTEAESHHTLSTTNIREGIYSMRLILNGTVYSTKVLIYH